MEKVELNVKEKLIVLLLVLAVRLLGGYSLSEDAKKQVENINALLKV